MNNYENLVKKYPLIFQKEEINPDLAQEPFTLFGFECGIGWYHIIDTLCEELYASYRSQEFRIKTILKDLKDPKDYIAYKQKINPEAVAEELIAGLSQELATAEKKLEELVLNIPIAAQVKEKFGSLRFYVNYRQGISETAVDVINALISFAESLSLAVCERCGNSGLVFQIGWHRTLCEQHAIEAYGKEQIDLYKNNKIP